MKILDSRADLQEYLAGVRGDGKSLGFVPTMGFLHEGHLSLIRQAAKSHDIVAVSVFVNPLQFNADEDLQAYPRDLTRDGQLAQAAGCSVLFVPSVAEMYPAGKPPTAVNVGRIASIAEGRYRPGHFAGVATVCAELFKLVRPDVAYFGQKDAQQIAVVRQMSAQAGLGVNIVSCPTVREPDGLAMSSRNALLTPAQRRAAPILFKGLTACATASAGGQTSARRLKEVVENTVAEETAVQLQYIEILDPESFEPLDPVDRPAIATLAAFAGQVRLIDNLLLAT